MTAQPGEFDALLDRFLMDELDDQDLERFQDLLHEPARPDRRRQVAALLALQERLEAHTGAPVVATATRPRRGTVIIIGAAMALAASALITLVPRWADTEIDHPTGHEWNAKGPTGAGPSVGLSIHALVRDPLTGDERRADDAEPIPQGMEVLPTLRCARPCFARAYLLDADGKANPLSDTPLQLERTTGRAGSWSLLAGAGDTVTWVGIAWPIDAPPPADPAAAASGRADDVERAVLTITAEKKSSP